MVSAEWQKIGGIEVREGTDGVVGVFGGGSFVRCYDSSGKEISSVADHGDDLAKARFERFHCQPPRRGTGGVMSVEQHAEAAANWIGETPTSTLGTIEHIIAKHMQSAIDEATAPLLARIAELEAERGHDATTKAN